MSPRIVYQNHNGERLQGITTIKSQQLGWGKQPLMIWANKVGLKGQTLNEARDTATIPGTIAHLLIENHLKPEILKPEHLQQFEQHDIDRAMTAFVNFLTWTDQFKFKPIEIEPHLVSEKYQIGGTPDVVAEVMGQRAIVDWKTGKIYEDVFLQLAFYQIVWEENNPDLPITGGFHVLRIPKDEDVPSFHHSHWGRLPQEATEAIKAILTLKRCEGVLKKLL